MKRLISYVPQLQIIANCPRLEVRRKCNATDYVELENIAWPSTNNILDDQQCISVDVALKSSH